MLCSMQGTGAHATLWKPRVVLAYPAARARAVVAAGSGTARLWQNRVCVLAGTLPLAFCALASWRCAARGRGRRSACHAMQKQHKKVAVVGAGPAGLATCRRLLEMGHEPVVFEKGSEVGGIWAPKPTNPVVYAGLMTNIPKYCMQTPELDFPKEWTSYISGAKLGQYFRQYCNAFKLGQHIEFDTSVVRITPECTEAEEAEGNASWSVSWRPSCPSTAEECSGRFDAVVVATGHYEVPYMPTLAGQSEWLAAGTAGERRLLHSVTYDKPAEFVGRSVLVVGGRSSGVDIARELREFASCVYVLDGACKSPYSEAHCMHLPVDAKLQADGSISYGGEVVQGQPVDDIVLATGYEYSFPFLDLEESGLRLGPTRRSVEPLFMHVMHARRPSLSFVGIPLAVPTPLLLFEAQARFIASQLSCLQSSQADREAWVQKGKEAVREKPSALHFLGDGAWEHMLELVKLSGLGGEDLQAYMSKFNLIREIYSDGKGKKPKVPWGNDAYRRCEYDVDWEAGNWTVIDPKG